MLEIGRLLDKLPIFQPRFRTMKQDTWFTSILISPYLVALDGTKPCKYNIIFHKSTRTKVWVHSLHNWWAKVNPYRLRTAPCLEKLPRSPIIISWQGSVVSSFDESTWLLEAFVLLLFLYAGSHAVSYYTFPLFLAGDPFLASVPR